MGIVGRYVSTTCIKEPYVYQNYSLIERYKQYLGVINPDVRLSHVMISSYFPNC